MKTTALLATAIDRVELVDVNIPAPGPAELVVEAIYTAVSPGTEMRCLAGRQPGISFPYIPGYSMVGRIIAVGSEVTLAPGTLVFCQGTEKADRSLAWGGHIRHALRSASSVFPLPEGVDPLDAALAKLAAIAYRGVRVAKTQPHEEVAVVGLGPIGQLSTRVHRLAGAHVVAADLDPMRAAVAQSAGIQALVPEEGLVESFGKAQPRGADVVVDSTGAPSVLQQSLRLVKNKDWDNTLTEPARVVIQGSYAENVVFDYHQAFYRELAVLFPRDNQARDIEATLRFIGDGQLITRDLISEVCPPREAQRIYSALRSAKPGLITVVFDWR